MQVNCPHCSQPIEVAPEQSNTTVACPYPDCSQEFTIIPEAVLTSPAPTPAPVLARPSAPGLGGAHRPHYAASLARRKSGNLTIWICVIAIVACAIAFPAYIKFAKDIGMKAQESRLPKSQPVGFSLKDRYWWADGETGGKPDQRLLYFTAIDGHDVLLVARLPRTSPPAILRSPAAELFRYVIADPAANPLSVDVFEPAPKVRMPRNLTQMLELSENSRAGGARKKTKRGALLETLEIEAISNDQIRVDGLASIEPSDPVSRPVVFKSAQPRTLGDGKQPTLKRVKKPGDPYGPTVTITYLDGRMESWDDVGFRYGFASGTKGSAAGIEHWSTTSDDTPILHFTGNDGSKLVKLAIPAGGVLQIWTEKNAAHDQIWNIELRDGKMFRGVERSHPQAGERKFFNPVYVELIGRNREGKLVSQQLFTTGRARRQLLEELRGDFVSRIAFSESPAEAAP